MVVSIEFIFEEGTRISWTRSIFPTGKVHLSISFSEQPCKAIYISQECAMCQKRRTPDNPRLQFLSKVLFCVQENNLQNSHVTGILASLYGINASVSP